MKLKLIIILSFILLSFINSIVTDKSKYFSHENREISINLGDSFKIITNNHIGVVHSHCIYEKSELEKLKNIKLVKFDFQAVGFNNYEFMAIVKGSENIFLTCDKAGKFYKLVTNIIVN